MRVRHFCAAERYAPRVGGLIRKTAYSVVGATIAAAAAQNRYPSYPTAAVDVFCAMPWKASISRPTGRIHTRVAANAAEAPSAVVDSRAAADFSMSQRDAMTNAIIASAP